MTHRPEEPDTRGMQVVDLSGPGPDWLLPVLVGLAWGAVMLMIVMERMSS